MDGHVLSAREEGTGEQLSESVKVVFSIDPTSSTPSTTKNIGKYKTDIELDINVDVGVHSDRPRIDVTVKKKGSPSEAITVHKLLHSGQGENYVIEDVKDSNENQRYGRRDVSHRKEKHNSRAMFMEGDQTIAKKMDIQSEKSEKCLNSRNQFNSTQSYEELEKVFAQIVNEYNSIFSKHNGESNIDSHSISKKGTYRRFEKWCEMTDVESKRKQVENVHSNKKNDGHHGNGAKAKEGMIKTSSSISHRDKQTQTSRGISSTKAKHGTLKNREGRSTHKYCKCNVLTDNKETQTRTEIPCETSIEEYLKPSEKKHPAICPVVNRETFESEGVSNGVLQLIDSCNIKEFQTFTNMQSHESLESGSKTRKMNKQVNLEEQIKYKGTQPPKAFLRNRDTTDNYFRIKDETNTQLSVEPDDMTRLFSEQGFLYNADITRELLLFEEECICNSDFLNCTQKPESYIDLLADSVASAVVDKGRQGLDNKSEKINWKKLELSKCFSGDKFKKVMNNNVKTMYKNLQRSKAPIHSKTYTDENANLLEESCSAGNTKYTPYYIDTKQLCVDKKRDNTAGKNNELHDSYKEETKEMDRIQKLDELINTLWPE